MKDIQSIEQKRVDNLNLEYRTKLMSLLFPDALTAGQSAVFSAFVEVNSAFSQYMIQYTPRYGWGYRGFMMTAGASCYNCSTREEAIVEATYWAAFHRMHDSNAYDYFYKLSSRGDGYSGFKFDPVPKEEFVQEASDIRAFINYDTCERQFDEVRLLKAHTGRTILPPGWGFGGVITEEGLVGRYRLCLKCESSFVDPEVSLNNLYHYSHFLHGKTISS